MKYLRGLPARRKYRIWARLSILVLASVAAYAFAVLVQEQHYVWAVVPAVSLGVLSILEFVVADLVIDARFPRETSELLERLQTKLSTTSTHDEIVRVLNNCVGSFHGCDASRVSSTVHLRIDVLPTEGLLPESGLIQISDYTRAGLGGRRWRVLEPTKGIVGRSLRLGSMACVNFATEREYQRRMVEEFGFTHAEVEQHASSARSYLAWPLIERGAVVAVLYFFSTEPQVFPVAADESTLRETGEHVTGLLRAADIL